jgi:hypothetical protein
MSKPSEADNPKAAYWVNAAALRATYSGIYSAAKEIAYDNGLINRHQTEDAFMSKVYHLVLSKPELLGREYDAFLRTLSNDDLDTLCCGEETDQQQIEAQGPKGLSDFLTEVFEL